jgi:hypothetical protein
MKKPPQWWGGGGLVPRLVYLDISFCGPGVGAVAAEGEGDLGDGAGFDLLGEVGDEGHACVLLGVAGGGHFGRFTVPLHGHAGGSVFGGFLEFLVACVPQVQVHGAGNLVALAGDDRVGEAEGAAVVEDVLGLGGSLDASVGQGQHFDQTRGTARRGGGGGAFFDVELVRQRVEKGTCGHGTNLRGLSLVFRLVCVQHFPGRGAGADVAGEAADVVVERLGGEEGELEGLGGCVE